MGRRANGFVVRRLCIGLFLIVLGACNVNDGASVSVRRLAPTFNFSNSVLYSRTSYQIGGVCEYNDQPGDVVLRGDFNESPLKLSCANDKYSGTITLSGADGSKNIVATYQDFDFNWSVTLDTVVPDSLTGISPQAGSIMYDNSTFTVSSLLDLRIPCEADGSLVSLTGDFSSSPLNVNCGLDNFARTTLTLANATYSEAQGPNTINIAQSDNAGNTSNAQVTYFLPLKFFLDGPYGDDATAVAGDVESPYKTLAQALTSIDAFIVANEPSASPTALNEEALAILFLEAGTYPALTLMSHWNPLIHIHGRYSDPNLTIFGNIIATGSDAADATTEGVADVECSTLPTAGFDVTLRSNARVTFKDILTRGGGWTNIAGGDCVGYANADSGNILLEYVYLDGDNIDTRPLGSLGTAVDGDASGIPGTLTIRNSWLQTNNPMRVSSTDTAANGVVLSPATPPSGANVTVVNSTIGDIESLGANSDTSGSSGGEVTVAESSVGDITVSGSNAVTLAGAAASVTISSNSQVNNIVSNGGSAATSTSGGTILIDGSSVVSDVTALGGAGAAGGTVAVSDYSVVNNVDVEGGAAASGGTISLSNGVLANNLSAAGGAGDGGVGGTIELNSSSANEIDVSAGDGGTANAGNANLTDSLADTILAVGSLNNVGANGNGGSVVLLEVTDTTDVATLVDISAGAGTGAAGASGTLNDPSLVSGVVTP